MWTPRHRLASASAVARRRKASGRAIGRLVERLEERTLLSGFLQGTVFDSGNSPLPGATVDLYNSSNALVGSVTTPASGYYQFDSLPADTYTLVETPPSGNTGNGATFNSPINPVQSISSSGTSTEVVVQVNDIAGFTSVDWNSANFFSANGSHPKALYFDVNTNYGNTNTAAFTHMNLFVDQLPITITNTADMSAYTTPLFSSYCMNILQNLDAGDNNFAVQSQEMPPALNISATDIENAGAIAYLYNTYGNSTSVTSDPHEMGGLQIALWELVYNSFANQLGPVTGAQLAAGNNLKNFTPSTNTTSADVTAILNAAAGYINQALGQHQLAVLLQATGAVKSGGDQSMIASSVINFTETKQETQQGIASVVTQIYDASTNQPIAGVVPAGTSVYDTATVTGDSPTTPTGTVTFNLYDNPNGTGTPLFTDANEPLVNGVATSGSYTTTALGTDYWVATYNGDSTYSPVTSETTSEPVTIEQATPSIDTQQQPAGATVGQSVADQATVSGGYNPTGTVTFNLYANSSGTGPVLFTDTEPLVNGVATSASFVTTAAGTDYWVATYNGDSNNVAVTSGMGDEPVTIEQATPSIDTQQQPAGATVGQSVADQATVSGGYNPTGTVTFSLYDNPNGTGTPLFTDTETLVGGVATSKGYTTTAAGMDYWVATYNGDSDNKSVTSGTADEPVAVNQAIPTLVTTPGGPVNLGGGITIGGTKYLDLTGNGFTADDTPQNDITINLYQPSGSGWALVGSTTTANGGTFSFKVAQAGTYYVQESVPSGYVQTGGGPNGTAGNTYYTVNAVAGTSYTGYNFDDFAIPNCNTCGSSSFVFRAGSDANHLNTISGLGGHTSQGQTVTVKLPYGSTSTYTLVTYAAPTSSFSDSNAYQQLIYSVATGTYATATNHMLTVTIPNSYYQIDLICGLAIDQLEPNQNNGAYGPDSAEILYHAQGRFIDSDNGGYSHPTTLQTGTVAAPPNPTSTAVPAQALTDSALLSGTYSPGGSITFYLFAPGVTPASDYSNNIYSDRVAVAADGTYTTADGTNPGGYTPTQAGVYQWIAVYSGDTNNASVTDQGGASEQETVNPATLMITTVTNVRSEVINTGILKDTAILSGGSKPTGTIVFTLTSPSGVVVDTETVTVNGDGTYTTPTGYVPIQTGTYYWVATYQGDGNNPGVASGAHDEPVDVTPSCDYVTRGEFATIGFWHNKNGQQLIDELNGGGSSTALGNWLAASFPHLYGASADPSNPFTTDLTGATNDEVASFFLYIFKYSSTSKTYAQIMAVALASYATDPALAGGNYAQSFGFIMQTGGSGIVNDNVGRNGSALGLSNWTSYAVLDLLTAADQASGTLKSNLSAVNSIFDGINSKGDIS